MDAITRNDFLKVELRVGRVTRAFPDEGRNVVLCVPDSDVPLGSRLF